MKLRVWPLLLLALLPVRAAAQIVPERELEITKALYDAGKYSEALARAREAMAAANFTEAQRVKLHELAGLSAFNLGTLDDAKQHFLQLLKLNPDYLLDPFAVPPPAIKAFERVRVENADALNLIRQQIVLRADAERRAATERERVAKEQEERRRRLDELSRTVTVRTVERRDLFVNFLPFGAGQFQQGRTGWGVGFAVTEGLLALASLVGYFALEAMFEPIKYTWTDRLTADNTGRFEVQVRRIPESRRTEATVWRTIKTASGVGFYAVWALGVGEALWHHQAESVTETKLAPTPEPAPPPAPKAGPKLNLHLSPSGLGAGLTLHF